MHYNRKISETQDKFKDQLYLSIFTYMKNCCLCWHFG